MLCHDSSRSSFNDSKTCHTPADGNALLSAADTPGLKPTAVSCSNESVLMLSGVRSRVSSKRCCSSMTISSSTKVILSLHDSSSSASLLESDADADMALATPLRVLGTSVVPWNHIKSLLCYISEEMMMICCCSLSSVAAVLLPSCPRLLLPSPTAIIQEYPFTCVCSCPPGLGLAGKTCLVSACIIVCSFHFPTQPNSPISVHVRGIIGSCFVHKTEQQPPPTTPHQQLQQQ